MRVMRSSSWTVLLAATSLLASCSKDEPTPLGGLMVVIATNVDVARVDLEILAERDPEQWQPLWKQKYLIPNEVQLPTTLAIVGGSHGGQRADVRVLAYTKNANGEEQLSVIRQSRAVIPRDRIAMLVMGIGSLCVDKIEKGAAAPESSCDAAFSCDPMNGECKSIDVAVDTLDTYREHAEDTAFRPPTPDASADAQPPSDGSADTSPTDASDVGPDISVDATADVADVSTDILDGGDSGDSRDGGDSGCGDILNDPQNCGRCKHDCRIVPNVIRDKVKCVQGKCEIAPDACQAGYAHCTSSIDDGCETDISTSANCGACSNPCPQEVPLCGRTDTGGYTCTAACTAPSPDKCGYQCVDLSSNAQHCGTCNVPCQYAHARAACTNKTCRLAECVFPYEDCKNGEADGCETNTRGSDVLNCGGCGKACLFDNAVAVCNAGECGVLDCKPGYGDCANGLSDGCETAILGSDPLNCGGCGKVCRYDHAQATCTSGSCRMTQCLSGYSDCRNGDADGCETGIMDSLDHCGGCNSVCGPLHAEPKCELGKCMIQSCQNGWGDCTGGVSDGCETNLATNDNHCSVCNSPCLLGQKCASATCNAQVATCNPPSCEPQCVEPGRYNIDEGRNLVIDLLASRRLWQRSLSPSIDIASAQAYCTALNQNGITGWRIPTKDELTSILYKPTGADKCTPSNDQAAFQGIAEGFWYANTPDDTGIVSFADGTVSTTPTTTQRVRCVHDPIPGR